MHFNIAEWIVRLPVLLFCITIHEYAHGRVAYALGDPTAKMAGRLTLNPFYHLDPIGAIVLFLFNFGWAKPVPVDPRYFKNIKRDTMLMAMAGPGANIAMAIVAGLLIRHLFLPWKLYQLLLLYMLFMNIGLGLFNLIPIPPLDGSHILENLLPLKASIRYQQMGRYGLIILFSIVLLDSFAHTGILTAILIYPMFLLAHLFAGNNLMLLMRMVG